jgi:molybdopterin/thiamine biosynthesis adenylyltransferase
LYPRRDKGQRGHAIVVVGIGALGTAAAGELAAGGVAQLGLVDGDRVELSNLHRQLLHGPNDTGRPKAEVAAEKIGALYPGVRIAPRSERFCLQNADEILEAYDVVIDATDDAATKFALNDSCVERGVPLVHAGVVGFNGQLMTIVPGETACLRCLFPEAPDDDEVGSCSHAGVLGPLAAMIGVLEAREALALVAGNEVRSAGRLLTIDARSLRMREVPLRRSATCPVCALPPPARCIDAAAGRSESKETR